MIEIDKLEIGFSENINSFEFEKILRKYYAKSKLKKTKQVLFDFKSVTFCGLLELSQISLWISHLISKSKKVKFEPPKDLEFLRFLYNYEFINFLIVKGIIGEQATFKKPFAPYSSPMFPMKFQDNKEFKDFLYDLNTPGRLNLLLSDIKDSDLVKNNVVHSVILKEIGDNIFIHSRSKFSNIIMTKLKKLSAIDCAEFEGPFLRKIGEVPVLNIVISDSGTGLFKKLIGSYITDDILPADTKMKNATEPEIIKYAFLKHSTSRTDEERKLDLLKHIRSDTLKYPLPTGLYKVKNIVKQYGGLLYVRSGRSIVCFDFLSIDNEERVFTNEIEPKLNDLSHFPGTQFKIYFPINKDAVQKESFYAIPHTGPERSKSKILEFLSLNDYIDEFFVENDDITSVQRLLDRIESIKLKYKKKKGAAIIDVANFKFIKSKNIKHLIVATIMASQSINFAFIIVNLDKKLISEFHLDYSDENFFDYFRPLLSYDQVFKPRIIGLESSFYNDILSAFDNRSGEEKNEYLSKCQHIFSANSTLTLNFNTTDILQYYSESLSLSVGKKIIKSDYNVYYPDQKVLVQNKYYCLGFFDLTNIKDSQLLSDGISTWISLNLQIEKPDVIVSIGESARQILDLIYINYRTQDINIKAKKFHVDTSNIYLSAYRLKDKISAEESVVIIADVIGSAKTITTALEKLQLSNIKIILTIINATPSNTLFINKIVYPIKCIIEKKIEYFSSMPKNWDYGDIRIYDPKSNRLLEVVSIPKGSLNERGHERGQVRSWLLTSINYYNKHKTCHVHLE